MESLNLPSILTPDFGLLFWMLVAFIFLFIILAKFGFPVITGMVEQRKAFIDESLSHAKAANEKLAGIQAESDKVLREAREKQAEILREATATRDAMVKEAKTLAEAEGLKLLDEAKAQIQVEKANALRSNSHYLTSHNEHRNRSLSICKSLTLLRHTKRRSRDGLCRDATT